MTASCPTCGAAVLVGNPARHAVPDPPPLTPAEMEEAHRAWVTEFESWKVGKDDAAKARQTMRANVGRKDDAGRDRWDLLPTRSLRAIVRVLTSGAAKYGDENWRRVSRPRARYYAAALRHLAAWWEGELMDPESGHPHLAHAACCLLFLAEVGK